MNGDLIAMFFYVGGFAFLMSLGAIFGRRNERKHFESLRQREQACATIITTQTKSFLGADLSAQSPQLIVAETVIASDYLKTFLGKLRNIFGGEVKSFETLLERGRREVTQQLKEQAARQGYNAICNVRLNTANVGGMGPKAIAMASIIGWATAYHSTLAPSVSEPGVPHHDGLSG